MAYTVSDLYHTYDTHLKLIAGKGGLARCITGCGILDYELMPELKDRYYHTNFQEGQFIVSSLLYTKDNPYLLSDAIKHLMSKGASGLAVRNVFHIQIPENVIRYADARNFPIFLVQSVKLPFENIIYTINRQLELESSSSYLRELLNRLMMQNASPDEFRKQALKLNPSFTEQYFCIYFRTDPFISEYQQRELLTVLQNSELFTYEDFLGLFRSGILIVKSGELSSTFYNDAWISRIFHTIDNLGAVSHIGISNMHNTLMEFREALDEVIFASAFNNDITSVSAGDAVSALSISKKDKHERKNVDDSVTYRDTPKLQYYNSLGSFQLIFPYCRQPDFKSFSDRIMNVLEEYDAENGTALSSTLTTFILCDSSSERTAACLNMHEQSIRYRMSKIYELTGLDRKSADAAEQLSLAAKIYLAAEILDSQE